MAEPGLQTSITNPTTTSCPAGQVLQNGVCVPTQPTVQLASQNTTTPTTPATQPNTLAPAQPNTTSVLPSISGLYGDYRSSLEQTTGANIEASRAQSQMTQDQLSTQLEQQRQDYLRNRQSLQRDTFLRGRNILSNLANRGLATSGLLQLGDTQRAIATGQQMNELSRAFENARQNLTAQQAQVGLQQQTFEGQQQSQLAQQLAGLGLQERQANIQEAERVTALVEDTISAGQTVTPEQSSLLNQIYAATAAGDTTALQQLLAQAETEGVATTGSLTNVFGQIQSITPQQLVEGISNYTGTLTANERDALFTVVNDSENLKQDAPFIQAMANKPNGFEITPTITVTKGGKAGLNDTYTVSLDGTQYNLEGRELAVLIMNGKVSVSPELAVSIVQRAGGRVAEVGGTTGNKFDAVLRPYLQYLQEQGFITGSEGLFRDYKITIDNPIR